MGLGSRRGGIIADSVKGLGNLQYLPTTNKDSIVGAIQEIAVPRHKIPISLLNITGHKHSEQTANIVDYQVYVPIANSYSIEWNDMPNSILYITNDNQMHLKTGVGITNVEIQQIIRSGTFAQLQIYVTFNDASELTNYAGAYCVVLFAGFTIYLQMS